MRVVRNFTSQPLLAHGLAAGLALYYAWLISQSAYVKTGLQFVTPLLVIMSVHLVWLGFSHGFASGFSSLIYRRSSQTAVFIALSTLLVAIFAPQPVHASQAEDILSYVLIVIFCVVVIAVVTFIISVIISMLRKLAKALFKRSDRNNKNGGDGPAFEIGSLIAAFLFLR